ncbi:RNA polymerase sigma factor [Ruania alba]|uniref:RNA polymerase sigma-70 factor, ECF subfamily n=1 Tax=Ruania alba TaxID=648782 RepID=A0A1H5DTA9_9MICO|nr:RNA polymerase sigma factor [Ruania alba]SED82142.1 RNA polymerase sigma-70 factor, ECF subfamily [Ruania alba]
MKAGPEGRFETLYWENHRELLAFIRRRTEAEAEDIVAETFVVAWRRIDDVPVDARPWLFGVARNVLRNHLRAQNRQLLLKVRIDQQPEEPQTDLATSIANRQDLADAWNRLTPAEQEVISLVAWEELSNDQAATVLGTTKSAFAVRLFRARRRLLHLLNRTTQKGGHHG